MVGTRSGARIRARRHIPGRNPIQERGSDSESSDDDEEIPNASPPKSKVDPSIRALDYRRDRLDRSLQLDDDQSLQNGHSKRRKLGPAPDLRTHPYPTPDLFSITHPPSIMTFRKRNRSSSSEDAVPVGLVSSVNAALKKKEHGGDQQLNGTFGLRDGEDAQVGPGRENIDAQGLYDQPESTTLERDRSPSLFVSERDDGHQPDDVLTNDNDVRNNSAKGKGLNIWDVPVSPEQPRPSKRRGIASTLGELSLRGGRIEVHIPLRRFEQTQSSQSIQPQVAEQPQPAAEADRAALLTPAQPDSDVDPEQEEPEDAEDENSMEDVDPFSIDDDISDMDLSSEESFAQDVANFRVRHPEGYKDGETFVGPPEDDDVTTHIDPSNLKMALRLMGQTAWAGLGSTMYRQSPDFDSADTEPVRALLQLMRKIDRLLVAAPKAPRITEQNKFLDEYSDILGYYFSKARLVLRQLRGRLREGLNRSRINDDMEERSKMSKEIVSLAIPMLFHVLASAWNLGGDDWRRTAFTISTVELLTRALGWIELLYRPLLGGLKQILVDEVDDEPAYEEMDRQIKRGKREELDGLLQKLRGAIEAAPDELEREERRHNRVHQGRRNNLERQKEILAQWKQEEEERMRSIEERQWRSLMSIRGVHRPLSETSIPPSSARSSLARRVSSQVSSRAQSRAQSEEQPHAPLSPQNADDWSMEEKTFLFKKIQESYPDLLDLDDVRWSLNRSLEETEAKAEELLGLMLEAVHPEQAAAERNMHVQEVMQAYRRTWRHDVA
ncbi:hypothetical protein F5Y13DRAFT_118626 [Hypoxylon sp. FL1857]|nr:hypothetical protein F5Y13DRAFT_118626 [Hypoxylon sp. FL1857]